jgi:hypothetical protein
MFLFSAGSWPYPPTLDYDGKFVTDKHCSLLGAFENFIRKKNYNINPRPLEPEPQKCLHP